ncbi:MAG: hypothetical protein HYX92_07875 [Chloroflexi bacterium]|nr:hypothetical protein [Chloroflexota bacterium]
MKKKNWSWMVVSLFLAVGLILSCAPAAPSAPTPKSPPPAAKAPAVTPTGPNAKAPSPAPTAPAPMPKPAADQPRSGGILTIGSRHTIPHFDMHQETSAGMQIPLSPAYSVLVRNDSQDEDKVIGDLARSWEVSPDGLAYTFRLQQGVKFHDGKPLAAEDVKFNLDRVIFPPRGVRSPRKELYAAVEKIEAPDPVTVKVTLKYPQASLLQLLAIEKNFIFAPYVVKEKGDMKADILGSGPFKLQSYARDVSLKLQKNPDYYVKGRPYLDGITVFIVTDEMARFAALRTKQVLLIPLVAGPTDMQAKELKTGEPRLMVGSRLTPNMTSLIPNTKVDPWNDLRVRQAVNLALDREAGAKVIRAGSYDPGYGYALPGSPWALPDSEISTLPGFRKPKDPDIAEAKKLLSQAGHPQGFKTTLMTSTSVYAKETAEFAKDQLARIGINATIQVLELAASRDRLFKGTFELAAYADGSSHEEPDLLLNEYYLTGSAKNYGAWSNFTYDQLYAGQSRALDPAKRKELVWEMQRVIHKEAPKMIVTWGKYQALWWSDVKNWSPHKSVKRNHRFEDVWLAP